MDMTGEERISAKREIVWQALNSPNVLRKCITNCESLEKKSPTQMLATVKFKVGPIPATFKGDVTLANLNAPQSYTIIVDGQDADAVYRVAKKAFDKARSGGGPSLIECLTYRYSGHSRADPAKYRPEGELERWKQRDPIRIYRARLLDSGVAESVIAQIETDVKQKVDKATEACKAAPPPADDLIWTDVYADGGWAWRN